MTSFPDPGFDHTAWSWVEHVRNGGTTPWASWTALAAQSASQPASRSTAWPSGRLPGAAQLEVVRRLAERRGSADLDFAALADLVLERSGPGRGLGEIPLVHRGSDHPGRSLGTPAADPSQVPVEELVRVCVGALCDLVAERPRADAPARPRRRPWARSFRLAGPPVTTSSLRASLAASGQVEGGRRPRVIVVAGTLDDMLREVWTARVQRGANVRWSKFVGRWVREDRLPMPADLPLLAAHWAARVGADRVHVVAPPHDDGAVRRTAGEILHVTAPAEAAPDAADVLDLPPHGVDVLRRLNAVLNVRVEPARHPSVLREASRHLRGDGEPLLVPAVYADWAEQRSGRMAEELSAGGYAVHGDLREVASRRPRGSRDAVHRADVLDIALSALLRASER